MARKKSELDAPAYALVSDEEIEYRKRLADMRLTEERAEKERFNNLSAQGGLCTVVDALDAFDKFLVPFVDFIGHFPDYVQAVVPNLTPTQYGKIKAKISDRLREIGENRLAIKVHTTKDTLEENRAYHDKSARLSAERKGK
ncbi:MAG: hypothetical protein ACI4SV_04000 [Duodenibacillus sp.]